MIVRVLPVEQNWRGRGGRRKKKEKVNEAHLSGRNTILRLIRLALNRAGRHRNHWFATGERSSKEAAVFASMKKKKKAPVKKPSRCTINVCGVFSPSKFFTPARM